MGVGDEEEIRRAFLARHPGLRIPSPNGDHLVDLEGHVYRRSATGWYRTAENNWRAASQLRGAMAVYVAKSVAGQPLYEDPRLVPPITGIPPLPLTAPPTNRGGATRHHSKTPEALIPQITHVSTYQEGSRSRRRGVRLRWCEWSWLGRRESFLCRSLLWYTRSRTGRLSI
jgi:hypothetical protein